MGRLDGRVAIITGAGRGIGASLARFMAAVGCAVLVNDLGGDVDGSGGTDFADILAVLSSWGPCTE